MRAPRIRSGFRFPSKEEFRAWLSGLPGDEVVSVGWSSCNCPLAEFLKVYGVERPSILPGSILSRRGVWQENWRGRYRPRNLPGWANEFGNLIDELGKVRDGRVAQAPAMGVSFGPVTARDCLRMLDLVGGINYGE